MRISDWSSDVCSSDLWIDQNSVRFLSPDELEALGAVGLLRNYLNDKAREIERWNAENADERPINQRRPTNIGTFRAYVIDYLRAHRSEERRVGKECVSTSISRWSAFI